MCRNDVQKTAVFQLFSNAIFRNCAWQIKNHYFLLESATFRSKIWGAEIEFLIVCELSTFSLWKHSWFMVYGSRSCPFRVVFLDCKTQKVVTLTWNCHIVRTPLEINENWKIPYHERSARENWVLHFSAFFFNFQASDNGCFVTTYTQQSTKLKMCGFCKQT